MVLRLALFLAASLTATVSWASEAIVVQSTTSTANSGLYDHLLPIFTGQTGITVNVVAVGTGQAIKNASNCDGDVLLVHAKSAEETFVAEGKGVSRVRTSCIMTSLSSAPKPTLLASTACKM